ncbi:hypothetical protein K3495_g4752 [Podosphaera aphanis]|nr:hypothetical protein K3495_g4752 [Podosphaera aphanis]
MIDTGAAKVSIRVQDQFFALSKTLNLNLENKTVGQAKICFGSVKWIPGHKGIPRNEAADQLTREALGQITDTEVSGPLSIASAGRKARALAQNLCRDWWDSACPKRYEDLNLQMHRKNPPELALSRAVYARLIAARTSHRNLASYHRRLDHDTAPLLCDCGREKSIGHLVQCRRALNRWRQISGRRRAPPLQTLPGAQG